MTTLRELLEQSVEHNPDAPFLRHKSEGAWQTISYGELHQRVSRVAQLLHQLHVKPAERVAMLMPNGPCWPEIYYGIATSAFTAVPVDAQLREQEVAHILRDSQARVLFVSSSCYALLKHIEAPLPELRHIILIEDPRQPIAAEPEGHATYHSYGDLLRDTDAARYSDFYAQMQPAEHDIASVIYTSGTTGRQKGAMLTHRNFVANVRGIQAAVTISSGDNFLLVLPLHHAFAFTGNLLLPTACGAQISLVESLRTVAETMREVSPSVLIAVPLLVEKMLARIEARLAGNRLARLLVKLGLGRLIRHKLLAALGGQLRLIVVGGAPTDPAVLQGYMRLGIPIVEGYGLTESSPVLALNPPTAPRPGSVGKALPGVDIRISSPNAEGVGEICAKGHNIMAGYYRNEAATREVIHDGWLSTGDLGYIDNAGYIVITGRCKNLIVNREGKNIYPEEIERAINGCRYVLESLALGEVQPPEVGERVGLIVVPDWDAIDGYKSRNKPSLTDGEVDELIRGSIRRGTEAMASYKRPRSVKIRHDEFEKTSTGKIKRYLYAPRVFEV